MLSFSKEMNSFKTNQPEKRKQELIHKNINYCNECIDESQIINCELCTTDKWFLFWLTYFISFWCRTQHHSRRTQTHTPTHKKIHKTLRTEISERKSKEYVSFDSNIRKRTFRKQTNAMALQWTCHMVSSSAYSNNEKWSLLRHETNRTSEHALNVSIK